MAMRRPQSDAHAPWQPVSGCYYGRHTLFREKISFGHAGSYCILNTSVPLEIETADDAEKFKMRHATAHTNISEPERMESDNSKPSTVPLAAPSQW